MARLVIKLGSRKKFNRQILDHDGVQREVSRHAREIEGKARAKLAKHRDARSAHQIVSYRERHTRVVGLEGPAAMSVQVGHHQKKTGKWVEGLHILPDGQGGNDAG